MRTSSVTRCNSVMSETPPRAFSPPRGATLINANHKQISFALMHRLSYRTLMTQVSLPSHVHPRRPIWQPFTHVPADAGAQHVRHDQH